MDITPYAELLSMILSPHNETRRNAELTLETQKTNAPDNLVAALVQILKIHTVSLEIRNLAAVLLRDYVSKKSKSLWGSLHPSTVQLLKTEIMTLLEQESSLLKPICDLTSTLANTILSEGADKWNELLEFLAKLGKSQREEHRLQSMTIFSNLLQNLAEDLEVFYAQFASIFRDGFVDTSFQVRIAAMTGASHLLSYDDTYSTIFKEFLPQMIEIITAPIDEELKRKTLSVLIDFVEICPDFFSTQLDAILTGMLTIASLPNYEDETKQMIFEFVLGICESKPSYFRKNLQITTNFTSLLLQMMTQIQDNPKWNLGEEYDCEDVQCTIGSESLDRLALSVKGELVPILFSFLEKMLSDANWKFRHAALTAISIVGEGCFQVLSSHLDKVMEMIYPRLQDPHERVRWSACNTIGQMSTDFGPKLQIQFHQQILPFFIRLMDDNDNPRVQSHSAAAIVNFCDQCTPNLINPYANDLLVKLSQLMLSRKEIVLEHSITAVAAIADCIKDQFIPYYAMFVSFFKNILQQATDGEHKKLRSKAMEALSIIAVAVGKDVFLPDANFVMNIMLSIQDAIEEDDSQILFLQQSLARIAKCLKQEFVCYLNRVLPPLIKTASLKAEIRILKDDELDSLDEDKWKTHPIKEDCTIAINIASLRQKGDACTMILCYIEELKEGFNPYILEVAQLCASLLSNPHIDDVRSTGASMIPSLLHSKIAFIEKFGGDRMEVHSLFKYLLPQLLSAIKTETNTQILCLMLVSLRESVISIGRRSLSNEEMVAINEVFLKILRRFKKNQRKMLLYIQKQQEEIDADEMESLENELATKEELIVYLSDVMGKMLIINNLPYLQLSFDVLDAYEEFLQPNVRPRCQQATLYLFCYLVQFGDKSEVITCKWLPAVIALMKDGNTKVRQVALKAIGVYCQYNIEKFKIYSEQVLHILIAIFNHPESRNETNIRATENAISSLGQIIQFNSSTLDVPSLLSIWFAQLPVYADPVECPIIYAQFCNFVINRLDDMTRENGNLVKILQIIAEVYDTNLITNEIKKGFKTTLTFIQSKIAPEALQLAATQLSEKQKEKIAQICNE